MLAPCVQDGKTALIMASKTGHLDVVQALLEAGAKSNAKDGVGGRQEKWVEGVSGVWCLMYR